MAEELAECLDLLCLVVVGSLPDDLPAGAAHAVTWDDAVAAGGAGLSPHRVIDTDVAAILYTSGSTGSPKGVVLSPVEFERQQEMTTEGV